MQARLNARLQMVEDFLEHWKLPGALSERVRGFFAYVVHRQMPDDATSILGGALVLSYEIHEMHDLTSSHMLLLLRPRPVTCSPPEQNVDLVCLA